MSTTAQSQETCNISGSQELQSSFAKKVHKILKQYAFFNFFFISVAIAETLLALIFFNHILRSNWFPAILSTIFITLFCYFILKIYIQNKKPQDLSSLCQGLKKHFLAKLGPYENSCENGLILASSYLRLASALKDQEYFVHKPLKSLETLKQSFEKLSCWLHWRDFHALKEWLFFQAIEQYVSLIKEKPDHLPFHVELANAYVMLSRIYSLPPHETEKVLHWIPPEKYGEKMKSNFESCAQRAIEEFKILNHYNPQDPWVYLQLAYCYQDLKMPQEQIKALETISELVPEDYENLYKLGTLYFQEGQSAKGLKIYEQIKKLSPQKAESLIRHYGSYSAPIFRAD